MCFESGNLKSNRMKPKLDKAQKESCSEKLKTNLAIRLRRLFYVNYSARYIRFKGDLCTYQKHLDSREFAPDLTKTDKSWIVQAQELCSAAQAKLNEVRIDEGWKLLHEAQRLEAYSNADFRRATIIQLREEASKLNNWRSESVYKIIGFKDDKDRLEKVSAEELEMALQIRDEHYHALYYTNRLTRTQFHWLFFILGLLILLTFLYLCLSTISPASDMRKITVTNFIGILLFGLMGATTSSIFHFRNWQATSRIPEILCNSSITLSRIFVGAGFSIFIFIFLNSEIAKSIDIFNFEFETCYEFFTIAFVSGFSERFALNSIEKIIGNKD
jgi:hypothetical protein